MRTFTANADAVARLPDGFVINTKNEIGMRNLATKLRFLLLCQIASVAVVLDHLERAAWPATPDAAADFTGDAACCARRGTS